MRSLLIVGLSFPLLMLGGCSSGSFSDPVTDSLAKTPFMYKPDIQQGNVVTQDKVNQLQPGMSRDQVRFLLGTPMLQDTFHRDRMSYVYTMKRGGGQMERRRLTLFFKGDQLQRVEGDYRPDPSAVEDYQETVVSVPDHEKKGFFDSAMKKVGLDEKTKAAATTQDTKPSPKAETGDGPYDPIPVDSNSDTSTREKTSDLPAIH
jgi:outer membrane protein assembly factor BamE